MDFETSADSNRDETKPAPHILPPAYEPIGGDAEFHVQLEGFEGPLDLLLFLARKQKVDLAQISILQLSEQYLAFIETLREQHLDIAAEYLLVAAWLAYMKSCLLLPDEHDGENEELEHSGAYLLWKLKKLDAMRDAAQRLMTRPRLGIDFFARGAPEEIKRISKSAYHAKIYDILSAYADSQRVKASAQKWEVKRQEVISIEEARGWLKSIFDVDVAWQKMEGFMPAAMGRFLSKSARASSLGAVLEMAHEGMVEIRQDAAFAPIYVRRLERDPLKEGEENSQKDKPSDTMEEAA